MKKRLKDWRDNFKVPLIVALSLFGSMPNLNAKDYAFQDFSQSQGKLPPTALDQDWDFYWQSWLNPDDHHPLPDHEIGITKGWNQLEDINSKQRLGPSGYASYRFELRNLPLSPDGYELHFPFISTASHIYVFNRDNPKERSEVVSGSLGQTKDLMIPQIRDLVVSFRPKAPHETWIVLAQVSNFYHSKGGILSVPVLASGHTISERLYKDQMGYIFSMGVILVICSYNFMLFLRRREDRSSLTLALFCLIAALRTFANGNLGNLFFDPTSRGPYILKYILEYSTLCLEPLSYAAFIHLSFRTASWPKIMPIFVGLSALGTALTLVTLPIVYGRFLAAYQVTIVLQAVFTLIVLVRALKMRMEGASLALGSAFILALTIGYDMLVSYNILPQPYIMQYGIDMFVFLQSQVVARRFATAFRTAERLQNELQIEVERQTQEIRSMMEHVPQGIFLILDDRTVQPHYSKHLEDILGQRNLGGVDVGRILMDGQGITADQKSIMDTVMLSAFGEDMMAWDVNSGQMPTELNFTRPSGERRILEMDWHPITAKNQKIERILVTIRDVTNLRVLQAENLHRQIELDRMIELLGTAPGTLPRFFEHAGIHLERSRNQLASTEIAEQVKRLVFIELHSLKGLVRAQGLRSFATIVHEAEQHYAKGQDFNRKKLQQDLDELFKTLDDYQKIYRNKISREANQGAELHLERQHLVLLESKLAPLRTLAKLDRPSQELMTAVQDFLNVYLYRSATHVFDELFVEVKKLAHDLGKENPRITLIGIESFNLLPMTEVLVRSSFLHAIRNSLDHGIESAAERIAKGKSPEGHVVIACREENNRLEITYEDDGRGLNIAEIEVKARSKGFWTQETPMTVLEATEMLFHSGFSTKDKVSEISGRGVGLDALRSGYRDVGGDMNINLEGVDLETPSVIPFRLWGYLPKTLVTPSQETIQKVS